MSPGELEATGSAVNDRELSGVGDAPIDGEVPGTADDSAGGPDRIPTQARNRYDYATQMRQSQPVATEERSDCEMTSSGEPARQPLDGPAPPNISNPPRLAELSGPASGLSQLHTDAQAASQSDESRTIEPLRITRYHSEFKGQVVDLCTDGTRWGDGNQKGGESIERLGPGGLSGDIDDFTPTGEQLVDTAGEDASRQDRLRRIIYRRSDDAMDALQKNIDLGQELFERPSASSHEGSLPGSPYVTEMPHYGIDAGSIATSAFTVGVLIDRGIHWLMRHRHTRKGHGDAGD